MKIVELKLYERRISQNETHENFYDRKNLWVDYDKSDLNDLDETEVSAMWINKEKNMCLLILATFLTVIFNLVNLYEKQTDFKWKSSFFFEKRIIIVQNIPMCNIFGKGIYLLIRLFLLLLSSLSFFKFLSMLIDITAYKIFDEVLWWYITIQFEIHLY